MTHPFITRLERTLPLSGPDREAIERLTAAPRAVPARQVILGEDEPSRGLCVVMQGYACCFSHLRDGGRQITGFLLPGDCSSLPAVLLGARHSGIASLSPCLVATVGREALSDLLMRHPQAGCALWSAALTQEQILREWIVNIGARSADRRVAHLFCELLTRLRQVGRTAGDRCVLPLTQEDLADTLGLSTVHVNRTLQALRGSGLLRFNRGVLSVPDPRQLEAFAGFTPDYLEAQVATEVLVACAKRDLAAADRAGH
ncbi:Crp/Fnr family transcriptional regulator [Methylobacterium oryzisoli]|uniref:Crp/Fnr family transcriptional regulator n=1 Tax=Methylobacterium oryzisoli TaxID=3385502 RepID=UPI003891BBE1